MRLVTASEALFSLKTFAAAMLALYLAMCIGLPRPFWALMTAYVVASPFAGPVRSKAVYRVVGTVLGAIAVTLLVPRLAHAPELLALALSLWIGACLYVSLLDRTPRSYVLMLAGYTAGMIAFPAVNDPGAIFDLALARVEEIVLGIMCATLVHSLVLPQSFGPVLLARLDKAVRDAQTMAADALTPDGATNRAQDRRRLAGDITELRMMASHLPFDTSHLRWTANAIRALQERLAALVPLVAAIEDRLSALRQLGGLQVPSRWPALLADITAWSGKHGELAEPGHEAMLRREIDALSPTATRDAGWRELVELNLAERLHALMDICVEVRTLRGHIDAGVHGKLPEAARHLIGVPARALHVDHGQALISAAAAAIATLGCCAFWIMTGWPSGASAPMMAAVMCCFFATQDDPTPMINGFTKYTVYAIPLSALYLLGILPALHNFETFVLACAPVFLVLGVLMARPASYPNAMPFFMGLAGTLALQETSSADFASFANGTLAQVGGLMAAAVTTRVLRTFGSGWTARRLLKAGWRELARLGRDERVPSPAEFSARMVDRIALLTPRLALAHGQQDLQSADALVDLRIGLNMAQLHSTRGRLGRAEAALWPLFEHLAQHFEARPAVDAAGEVRLLASLDSALRAVCAAAPGPGKQPAVAALAGIRRAMFPDAAPYAPAPALYLEKEIR